jgi:hypothetical protein
MERFDHVWVKLTYVPIVVEKTDEGDLAVSVDLVAETTAEEEALMGCWFCHLPLKTTTFGQRCHRVASK